MFESSSCKYSISKFIVGPETEAEYQTIQSAIDAAIASGGGTVFVKPGQYFENLDLRALDNQYITFLGAVALGDDGQCEIVGTHVPPPSGSIVFRNFKLSGDRGIFNSDEKGDAHIVIMDVYLNVKNGYTFDLPNWIGVLEVFDANRGRFQDGGINNIGGAKIYIYNSGLGCGSDHEMIVSGPTIAFCAGIGCPIKALGESYLYFDNTFLLGNLSTYQSAQGSISNCHMNTGSIPSINHNSTGVLAISNTTINCSSNNAIIGCGQMKLGSITFMDSSSFKDIQIDFSPQLYAGRITTSSLGIIESSEDSKMGVVTLTNGKATVYTHAIHEDSRVFLTPQSENGISGFVRVNARSPGKSFSITSSSNSDNSIIAWIIVDPS